MAHIVLIIHIIVCLSLVMLVLLQHGKGADMGATFGGSSQTVFGSDGPVPLLNKITTGAAIIFMITSVILAYHSAHSTSSSVMRAVTPVAVEQKVVPTEPETVPTEKGAATFPVEDAKPGSK